MLNHFSVHSPFWDSPFGIPLWESPFLDSLPGISRRYADPEHKGCKREVRRATLVNHIVIVIQTKESLSLYIYMKIHIYIYIYKGIYWCFSLGAPPFT